MKIFLDIYVKKDFIWGECVLCGLCRAYILKSPGDSKLSGCCWGFLFWIYLYPNFILKASFFFACQLFLPQLYGSRFMNLVHFRVHLFLNFLLDYLDHPAYNLYQLSLSILPDSIQHRMSDFLHMEFHNNRRMIFLK